jgi:hypothetical protein
MASSAAPDKMRIVHQPCYFHLTVKIGQPYTFYTETRYFPCTTFSQKQFLHALYLKNCYVLIRTEYILYTCEQFSTYM